MTSEDGEMLSYASINWPADPLTLSDWENLDLHESLRPEVVEGQLTIQPPRTADHQLKAMEVVEQLKESVGGDGQEVTFGIAVVLEHDPLTLRIPDVMVFRPATAPNRDATSIDASVVELVVEVTETGSRSIDRVLKRHEYAAAGIPGYRIVNAHDHSVECYSLHGEGCELRLGE
ncbi:Uma2 family endonuclease [Dermacoccus sp. 147Ba]|uniref:Uma2 family endonuclease n=1 Tax=Dermacoccus sp. 147Ba TaxID=2510111 RepID=UPI00101E1219|nr:Uma2 family endonuclease [Dermacoccus sp. 147Ba]RYI24250.1 Uma2 family endonuclease [Dermacoccus sp. 147Ba]